MDPKETKPAAIKEWLSDCCRMPPVGDVHEFYDLCDQGRRKATGYCRQCKEPAVFTHEDDE